MNLVMVDSYLGMKFMAQCGGVDGWERWRCGQVGEVKVWTGRRGGGVDRWERWCGQVGEVEVWRWRCGQVGEVDGGVENTGGVEVGVC